MLDPTELLAVARELSAPQASQAALRRAVSTAYYALFHSILRQAAGRFAGHRGGSPAPAYSIIYRAFEHGQMRSTFEKLNAPRLPEGIARLLGRTELSDNTRSLAERFVALQIERQRADYDPGGIFHATHVNTLVDSAETAIAAIGGIDDTELADVLALLMVKSRA